VKEAKIVAVGFLAWLLGLWLIELTGRAAGIFK
jgi:hypothetical protein